MGTDRSVVVKAVVEAKQVGVPIHGSSKPP
jgi:hypothetical protein